MIAFLTKIKVNQVNSSQRIAPKSNPKVILLINHNYLLVRLTTFLDLDFSSEKKQYQTINFSLPFYLNVQQRLNRIKPIKHVDLPCTGSFSFKVVSDFAAPSRELRLDVPLGMRSSVVDIMDGFCPKNKTTT